VEESNEGYDNKQEDMQKNGNTHLTRKKEAEPHQAKEQFFLKTTGIVFGKATFNLTGTFNNSKQTGQLQRKGQMEDLK
jgi:hypothetical protein